MFVTVTTWLVVLSLTSVQTLPEHVTVFGDVQRESAVSSELRRLAAAALSAAACERTAGVTQTRSLGRAARQT